MAGPLSPDARARSLTNDFGPVVVGSRVTTWIAHLYDDNPEFGGVELDDATCPGYLPVTFDNDEFEATDEGMTVLLTLADADDAWTKSGRYVVLEDDDTPGEFWDYVPINEVRATAAGPFTEDVELVIFWSDDSTDPS
jgi:hypothetical protein